MAICQKQKQTPGNHPSGNLQNRRFRPGRPEEVDESSGREALTLYEILGCFTLSGSKRFVLVRAEPKTGSRLAGLEDGRT